MTHWFRKFLYLQRVSFTFNIMFGGLGIASYMFGRVTMMIFTTATNTPKFFVGLIVFVDLVLLMLWFHFVHMVKEDHSH
jgi:hypothetical protein